MGQVSRLTAFAACVCGLVVAQANVSSANAARRIVAISAAYPAGTIVISQRQRKLYYALGNGRAIRYPVAIGRSGKAWSGWTQVEGKFVRPAILVHGYPLATY